MVAEGGVGAEIAGRRHRGGKARLQVPHRVIGAALGPLVEPFGRHELGRHAGGAAMALHLHHDAHEGLEGAFHRHRAEAERPDEGRPALEGLGLGDADARRRHQSMPPCA